MMQTIQRFKRNVVYPLAAAMMLNVGCATQSSHLRGSKMKLSDSRIEFVDQKDPYSLTFDELSKVVKDDDKTVGYMERFGDIKSKISSDTSYDAHQDMRSLVWDINASDLENKVELSNQMRDFYYCKVDEFIERPDYSDGAQAFWWTSFIVAVPTIVLTGNYLINHEDDEKRQKELILGTIAVTLAISIPLGYKAVHTQEADIKSKSVFRRMYFNPYEGTKKSTR